MDHQEMLKSMLQDVINDRMEQASVTMHDYFVAKTREVTGLAQSSRVEETTEVTESMIAEGAAEDVLKTLKMTQAEFQALSKTEKRDALIRAVEQNPDIMMQVMAVSREAHK